MKDETVIYLFRNDLRIADNSAFVAASGSGKIMPIFIYDKDLLRLGSASKVWLHHSLLSLDKVLEGSLRCFSGSTTDVLVFLTEKHGIKEVYFSESFDQKTREADSTMVSHLAKRGVRCFSFNTSVMWHPDEIRQKDGNIYEVFSPFFRKGCLGHSNPDSPLGIPDYNLVPNNDSEKNIQGLELLPKSDWHFNVYGDHWRAGRQEALDKLSVFCKGTIGGYKSGRNFLDREIVSKLSPHLRFGEISAREVWWRSLEGPQDKNTDHYRFELGWREFAHYQLYHYPDISAVNIKANFDGFPWADNKVAFFAWCRGNTGVPIVDAAMRELWLTGYLNNRSRLIVASFLTNYLLIDWRKGLAWFHDTLFDADPANNSASWQWTAGCGCDPVEYARIFNPVIQSKKFDPKGSYIKKYVPELVHLNSEDVHCPWILHEDYGKLAIDYPKPIVDLAKQYNISKSILEKFIKP